VTNAAMLATAVVGQFIFSRNRKEEAAPTHSHSP
jgi:hypothetical protein